MSYSHSLKQLTVCLAAPAIAMMVAAPAFSMDESAPVPFTCQAQYTGFHGNLTFPWFRAGQANRLGKQVLSDIVNAHTHGLNPADYQAFKLAARVGKLTQGVASQYPGSQNTTGLARINSDLTRAAICYLQQVHSGQLEPEMVHARTMLPLKFWQAASALTKAWNAGEVAKLFASAAPQSEQYRLLSMNLARSRQQLANKSLSNWKQITPAQQIAQIELAMERIRWLPREDVPRRIEVNIPEFKVRMTSRGRLLHLSKVVVGKPGRSATSLFAGLLSRVDLNPSWYVPHSIAKWKLLPKIRKDPEYARRKNMIITEKDGTRHREITEQLMDQVVRNEARIQQLPGSDNALGRYKFVLPNRRAIFMHDTNQPELFDKDIRAFSSGCVRIENADRLARVVLSGSQWNSSRIESRVRSGRTKSIDPKKPTLVVLTYQTARAINETTMHFFDDLYSMDAQAFEFVGRWSRAFAPVQKLAGR